MAPAMPEKAATFSEDDLRAANINPHSFLATDYLNYFNEFMTLFELVAAMPDMAAELLSWRPKSYAQHFKDTGFEAKELAITAYQYAPEGVRMAFDEVVAELDRLCLTAQEIARDVDNLDAEHLQTLITDMLDQIKPMLAQADGLIHGRHEPVPNEDNSALQADIDALFD